MIADEPRPARFEVEEARPVQEKRPTVEPGKSAGDDTTTEISVNNLVAKQVEPADMQRQPDYQGQATNDRSNSSYSLTAWGLACLFPTGAQKISVSVTRSPPSRGQNVARRGVAAVGHGKEDLGDKRDALFVE